MKLPMLFMIMSGWLFILAIAAVIVLKAYLTL